MDCLDETFAYLLTEVNAISDNFIDVNCEFYRWAAGRDQWAAQIRNHINAANGVPTEWHFYNQATRGAMEQLCLDNVVDLARVGSIFSPML